MIGIDRLPTKNAPTLNDYPFKAQVDNLLGVAVASNYDAAINEIWKRVNADYILVQIRSESVEKVINSYVNIIKSNMDTPIYNWYFVDKVPKQAYVDLVNSISNKTGVKLAECKSILKQLQSADADGSIVKGIHNPRTIDSNISNTPDSADSWKNKLDMSPYIKWGAIGVGTALLLVLGIKVMDVID